ncbi:GtrA family protein [Agrilactobacillus composti]|nr:GtrA family protein [Agrilactobacillus composti]
MKKTKVLITKYRNFLMYTLFGTLASLVNILAYWLLGHAFGWPYLLANSLAWFISVLFSFFVNKSWVFKSAYSTWTEFLAEFISFMLSRILSFFVDNFLMFVGISLLQVASIGVKIIDQVLVGLLNYLTSVLVFNRRTRRLKDTYQRAKARWVKYRQHK